MTREQLIAKGFTEEQVTEILKLHKETIDGNYIPKHRFDAVNEELKATRQQVTERDTQIAGLKKFEGDNAALQTKITELENENKTKTTEYQATLSAERKKNAIRMALLEDEGGKPYDTDMVMGLFNLDQIVLDEATGKISSGFKEQNENVRKERAFLFETKAEPNKTPGINVKGTKPKDGDKGPGPDTSESYGKSLAAIKLGMMGITPAGNGGNSTT